MDILWKGKAKRKKTSLKINTSLEQKQQQRG
jgi:hypothetical protein